MDREELIECIEHALKEVDKIFSNYAYSNRTVKLAKRADTIIGKLLDLRDAIEKETM